MHSTRRTRFEWSTLLKMQHTKRCRRFLPTHGFLILSTLMATTGCDAGEPALHPQLRLTSTGSPVVLYSSLNSQFPRAVTLHQPIPALSRLGWTRKSQKRNNAVLLLGVFAAALATTYLLLKCFRSISRRSRHDTAERRLAENASVGAHDCDVSYMYRGELYIIC